MEPLTVASTLDSLEPVAHYVLEAAERAGLDRRTTYWLRLAVDEIATNIVTHGYEGAGSSGSLTISADLGDQDLRIYLEDNGKAFDPVQTLPPHHLSWPPEQREAGGLGVYLALSGVDHFYYEQMHECNRSTFVVRRPCLQHEA